MPDRDVFKAAEVCEIAGVQSYVLRSWEQEFPAIGASRSPGGPRLYRRADVERILRIKDLVFTEGLTLAGARRRLEEEEDAPSAGADLPVDSDARERLGEIRSGLRALLDMLADAPPKKPGSWLPSAQSALLEFDDAEGVAAPAGGAKKTAKKKPAR
jgi:DNA-binding transcriptional MerR regulator